jgi:hypothetical protein
MKQAAIRSEIQYYEYGAIRALLVSCLAYSFNMNMEAIYFSGTSVDLHRTTRRHIPEDSSV